MSTITAPAPLFELPLAPEREQDGAAARSDGDRLTLEQRLDCVWEGLVAEGAAACVVCSGRLERTPSGQGICRSCGSRLS